MVRARVPVRRQPHRPRASTTPTATFYENYALRLPAQLPRLLQREIDQADRCSSRRSWTAPSAWRWCRTIQRKLEADAARPMLGWRLDYFTGWPYVKNLPPHHSLYNYARMQEVWLDR